MSKSTKVAEPILIGTEEEAKEYTSKNHKEGKPKLRAVDFSLECGLYDDKKKPPIPDMHYDGTIRRWMPDDVEVFVITHGAEFKKLKAIEVAKIEAMTDTIPDIRRPGFAVSGKPLKTANEDELANFDVASVLPSTATPVAQAKVSEQSESAVQQEDQSSSAPSTPKKQTKSSVKSKAKKAKEEVEKPDVQEFNCNIIADVPSVATSESNSETSDTEVPMATVEQSKSTRVSQKMVDTDFDTLAKKYLQVTSLAEKKPVFLPKNVRDTLEILARLSGDPRLSASHIAINIITAFIDERRDLINRKLGSVKLSI